MPNRRKFLSQLGTTAALITSGSLSAGATKNDSIELPEPGKIYSANDKIRLAGIGMGIQGFSDMDSALKNPGTEVVACCDLYTGRLDHAKEKYGAHVFTTKNYSELLDRKDIDAVIIASSDSWHSRISIEALQKGKAVYCEKPMVHKIEQGWDVINAQKKSGKTFQVGSQRVSSVTYAKAKELYISGAIGVLNSVEAVTNRQSALGAWEYTIPLDASADTIDWEKFQADQSKKHPFDEKRFFWWRNYREYGTGMAGDLFVHLLSGLHFITGSKGPSKIFALGDLSYWKDGRNVPDVMTSILHYPDCSEHRPFQVTLRVNFVSGEGDVNYTKITGSEGVMFLSQNKVTVKRNKMPAAPGIGGWDSLNTFTESMQARLKAEHQRKYKESDTKSGQLPDLSFSAPEGYSEHVAHLGNFLESVRTGKPVFEDATFGFRAAAPCLACNESYFQSKPLEWDPEKMMLL